MISQQRQHLAAQEADEARAGGDREPDEKPTADELSPRERLAKMFERSSPPLNSPLPDITVFDADGHPFELSTLEGHYSVIVFGCLT